MQIAIEYWHPWRGTDKDTVIVPNLQAARDWMRNNSDTFGGDLSCVIIYEIGKGFDPHEVYNLAVAQ